MVHVDRITVQGNQPRRVQSREGAGIASEMDRITHTSTKSVLIKKITDTTI
jgi:hypothetical protein